MQSSIFREALKNELVGSFLGSETLECLVATRSDPDTDLWRPLSAFVLDMDDNNRKNRSGRLGQDMLYRYIGDSEQLKAIEVSVRN